MLSRYREVLSLPGARAFATWGLIARLQMGMTGLATFLLVQMEYGSYAAGGVMLAAISVSYVVIAPQVARLVDAHGQARVLRWGYAVAIAGRVGLLVAALMGAFAQDASGAIAAGIIVLFVFAGTVAIVVGLPLYAAQARRLHDMGQSGWWVLLNFVSLGLVPLIMAAFPSQPYANEWGPEPVE